VYVCVLVLEYDFQAEINFDTRNEFTYLEFSPISYHNIRNNIIFKNSRRDY